MAVQTETISVNERTVGEVSVDPNEVRGSGGGLGPLLTVPMRFAMRTRPSNQLAVTGVCVELWLKPAGGAPARVGTPDLRSWLSSPLVSHDRYPMDKRLEASFDLSLDHIRLIEASVEHTDYLPLEVRVVLDLAAVVERNIRDGMDETGWAFRFVEPGRIHEIRLHVERSYWARPRSSADRC